MGDRGAFGLWPGLSGEGSGSWASFGGERPGLARTVDRTAAHILSSSGLRGRRTRLLRRWGSGTQAIERQIMPYPSRLETRHVASAQIEVGPHLALDRAARIER